MWRWNTPARAGNIGRRTMLLNIDRKYPKAGYTIGKLFIDGYAFSDTLEDTVRAGDKIPGQTAIPAGTYRLILSESKRFGRILPEILGVPGFTGVRIHAGNTAADSSGCVLIGKNSAPGMLTESRATLSRLMGQLYGKRDMWIKIG